MSRHKIIAMLAACAALTLSYAALTGTAAMARTELPSGPDRSLVRLTQNGSFRVTIASADQPVPLHKIHRWSVRLTDQAGRPVTGATFKISGGMPQHGHGLPTAPTAQPGASDGAYVIKGVKFSMDGWWELKLQITAAGVTDKVTFNIVL
jgi:hypothetical protein